MGGPATDEGFPALLSNIVPDLRGEPITGEIRAMVGSDVYLADIWERMVKPTAIEDVNRLGKALDYLIHQNEIRGNTLGTANIPKS
jgi:hypothetical protein